ncbi:hypothetical protein LK09_06310 [Microbacterium mangrovi]|uniref:Uncharacterized protein n=1 Tax=Microbacterium mangrovi TaxID=1348253 RepID=A0A0B2A4Y9_9MICO|nr:hypothetical protein [Microbacterium mangrovi]KHK98579.1 hypothetical protein LK09_06310 [Microbacterium mangrovi]
MGEREMAARDLAPGEARRIRDDVVARMGEAEAVAYIVTDPGYFSALVDFPLPDTGPSYVWTGAWEQSDDTVRSPPLLRIGVSPATGKEIDRLRHRMGITTGQPPRPSQWDGDRTHVLLAAHGGRGFAQFIDGTAYVLIVATATVPDDITISRLRDPAPLIERWAALSGSIPAVD